MSSAMPPNPNCGYLSVNHSGKCCVAIRFWRTSDKAWKTAQTQGRFAEGLKHSKVTQNKGYKKWQKSVLCGWLKQWVAILPHPNASERNINDSNDCKGTLKEKRSDVIPLRVCLFLMQPWLPWQSVRPNSAAKRSRSFFSVASIRSEYSAVRVYE